MEFFKQKTQYKFMEHRKIAMLASLLMSLLMMLIIAIKGLSLGLDFTGGIEVVLDTHHTMTSHEVSEAFDHMGFTNPTIQTYGKSNELLIRLNHTQNDDQALIRQGIEEQLPQTDIKQLVFIGPQMGHVMLINCILSLFTSIAVTMLYVSIRFEYRFAIGAAISLFHDPVMILGLFSLFGLEFNLVSLAALLTVIGYSLNDTIVVYDRIRENFKKSIKMATIDIINAAINETLSRTIMTSFMTLLVVISLLVFGGSTLFGFAFALTIGIVIGTYSSIYIAGALALDLGVSHQTLAPKKRTVEYMP